MLRQQSLCAVTAVENTWSEEACLFPPPSPCGTETAAVLITLTADEFKQCQDVARRLCEVNRNRPDAVYYDRDKMQDDYFADTAANGCELSVAKYIGQKWHARVLSIAEHKQNREQGSRLPDVGEDNEVRRTRKEYVVAIRRKDAGKVVWAVQLPDESNLCEYRIVGWIKADEALSSRLMDWDEADPSWGYYPLADLSPPAAYFTR